MEIKPNEIYLGDCLEIMQYIPDKSIDMILCDLPYGTTACKWDTVIPFEPLWEQYERIIKDNGAIVLFGSQPFTSILGYSNLKMLKYSWIWEKTKPTNFTNAKKMPLKGFEEILVFYKKLPTYNPQGLIKVDKVVKNTGTKSRKNIKENGDTTSAEICKTNGENYYQEFTNYPRGILKFPNGSSKSLHPTQKPVELCEYLIKTYTQPGEIVLDNCIGSGTTAIAALNTGRFFIGIEKEPKYVEIARQRVEQAKMQENLFV